MKKRTIEIGYWLLIVTVIAFCGYCYMYLTSEAKECMADPVTYYTERSGDVCGCSSDFKQISVNDISFNPDLLPNNSIKIL